MLKWLAKITAVALLTVSPMIVLIYQSSIIIDRQMQKYMQESASIAEGDSVKVLSELTLNMSVAYTYTYIIGSVLIIAVIWKLFMNYYRRVRSLHQENRFTDIADCAELDAEIDETFDNAGVYDYRLRNAIKSNNRIRAGIKSVKRVKENKKISDDVKKYFNKIQKGTL